MASTNSIKFTEREKLVLSFLALGVSDMDIAHHLGISNKTVSIFKITAMKKIGLRKNANLIKWLRTPDAKAAFTNGLCCSPRSNHLLKG
ncbi:TPA: response regulator transcription factor [Serratia marcescens]|uniref:Response regulator transcription factor n=1 Tax=Serratia marcescens TaxID=615 RepID=A0A9X8VEI7_SERMA|nr:LuxR C-terminal-related transcriptional regulator [Serratia marcescens]MBS3894939.1 response regulator transcription factor [Serratia marcescens]HBC7420629.1 response regulator transcription factor [Serratia marcescens]